MRGDDVLEKNPRVSLSALEGVHAQIFGWALSRCNYQREAAEDLVQQAYVELLTGRAKFDERSSLKTFVFAVVQNLARSRYRRIAARLKIIGAVARDPGEQYADAPLTDDHSALWRAVQRLPWRQRDIIELVFCRDMTIAEASSVMGVTTGTGRVHYDRAKKALRSRLDDDRGLQHE